MYTEVQHCAQNCMQQICNLFSFVFFDNFTTIILIIILIIVILITIVINVNHLVSLNTNSGIKPQFL